MKYCQNCGQQLHPNATYCFRCGRAIADEVENSKDTGSVGWGFLGFFFPLIGFILYLVWRTEQPKNAKRAGVGALVSVIISIVFTIIYFVVIASMVGAAINGTLSIGL